MKTYILKYKITGTEVDIYCFKGKIEFPVWGNEERKEYKEISSLGGKGELGMFKEGK